MTQIEVAYRYRNVPSEAAMRAIHNLRDVYGVRRLQFNEKEQVVRVEFDASRFKEPVVAVLLRRAGLDLEKRIALA